MKLWIAKNSEVPVHEQLVTQITIGIVSGDLAANEKLPSTREIARRFDIHSNTVSAAYRRLVEEGFLEFRKGKGYFVLGNAASSLTREQTIAFLLDGLIYQANELGFNLGDLIRLLKGRQTQGAERIRLVESDSGLGAIIRHELSSALDVPIDRITFEEFTDHSISSNHQLVAMVDEKPKIDPMLIDGRRCLYLKGSSASESMKGQPRPGDGEMIAVVSGWDGFLILSRVMLLAAKIEPGNLVVRSTNENGWRESVASASMIICDPLTASMLHQQRNVRIFNVVSNDSIAELSSLVMTAEART